MPDSPPDVEFPELRLGRDSRQPRFHLYFEWLRLIERQLGEWDMTGQFIVANALLFVQAACASAQCRHGLLSCDVAITLAMLRFSAFPDARLHAAISMIDDDTDEFNRVADDDDES